MAVKNSTPRGLYRRGRSKFWWYSYTLNGKRHRVSTKCESLKDARAFIDELKAASVPPELAEWSELIDGELSNPRSWVNRMIKNTQSRARKYRRAQLTSEVAKDALRSSGGRCAITGVPFSLAGGRSPYAPSFDRLDCSRGYEASNIRIVLCAVNLALSNWGDEVFHHIALGYTRKLADRV